MQRNEVKTYSDFSLEIKVEDSGVIFERKKPINLDFYVQQKYLK